MLCTEKGCYVCTSGSVVGDSYHAQPRQIFIVVEVLISSQNRDDSDRQGHQAHRRQARTSPTHLSARVSALTAVGNAGNATLARPPSCETRPRNPQGFRTSRAKDICPYFPYTFESGQKVGFVFQEEPPYMIAQPAIDGRGGSPTVPAWGLKEQLGRLRKDRGGASAAGEGNQDRSGQSKIRISVTGPALAHKIKEVRR